MKLYRYLLSCGHRKTTPDRRTVGTEVKCVSCAARGWESRRVIERVEETETELGRAQSGHDQP